MTISGSHWNRWDVHIHAPGTALADGYPSGSLDDYIARIHGAAPTVVALGVTDYLSLGCYKAVRERWLANELPGVRFMFPNIEFRISPPTKSHRGVNFHLLVDPSGDDHIEKIEAALARLNFEYGGDIFNCDRAGITRLGKKLDPSQRDDHAAYCRGVNEFKIDFSVFNKWLHNDPWLEKHSLVAVSNHEGDGVSGLSAEHGYAATIENMYRTAQIIFSGNPTDRKYWLGDGVDGTEVLHERFGGIKPCLHGSDAHTLERVARPDADRFCWIRAEPTFEGLRQVVFEPRERVCIGPDRPGRPRQNWIRSLSVETSSWFPSASIELNEGLVAIIGSRGSGKTALADLIAHAADAFEPGPASFLSKAMPEAAGTEVTLVWADRDNTDTRSIGEPPKDRPAVRYLSQHFVEQLCSADGASDRLIETIEEVVFESLDETDRLGTSSFGELRGLVMEGSIGRIEELRSEIARCSERVARELAERTDLPTKRERLAKLDIELKSISTALSGLVVKGKEVKSAALQTLRDEVSKLEAVVAHLKSQVRRIAELRIDFAQRTRMHLDAYAIVLRELKDLGIAGTDLAAFQVGFKGDVDAVLARRLQVIAKEIAAYADGPSAPSGYSGPLVTLKTKVEALQKEIGGDTVKERQVVELQRRQKSTQQVRLKLESEIKRAESADAAIREAQGMRLEHYVAVFVELGRQKNELAGLYGPLAERLAEAPPERKKLDFLVRQVVDVETWAQRGEQLLDLRRKGDFFRESGSLAKKAEELLGGAWRSGDADKIREQMSAFLDVFKDASKLLVPSATVAHLADWLFATDHIEVTYGIRYEGVDIERLSPGTRGIVLLILYLALDTHDDRPLIIDQPEENLDPQSIFDVLTGYFRDARERRQVIVVTHNPNLVVNTDSDQVIIASAERVAGEALPHFSYECGGLETPTIRKRVCQILEGGEQAFLQRERRYGLR